LAAGIVASGIVVGACGPAAAQTQAAQSRDGIPDLASISFAWIAVGADWLDPPAGSGHGPIRADPAHPFHGNLEHAG
jgi:hypothetical protein